MRVIKPIESSSSGSESSESEMDVDRRRVCMAMTPDQEKNPRNRRDRQNAADQGNKPDHADPPKACSHCGSIKHDDRGCWKRLTCQKCGRKGHLSDKCFYVCAACGEIHEGGKCPMKEFYNMIRKWYVPTKHAGMLPPTAEEILN